MKFIVRFRGFTINEEAWRKRLDAKMSKEIERAAIVWLNATVLLAIPVWSGASRATFLKLARAVSFPLTITGIKATKSDTPRALGPSVGFQQSRGKLDKDPRSGKFTFTYATTLFHLVFNEFSNANQNPTAAGLFAKLKEPGPYNFQRVGRDAFREFAKTSVELPSPWKKLKFTSIRAG